MAVSSVDLTSSTSAAAGSIFASVLDILLSGIGSMDVSLREICCAVCCGYALVIERELVCQSEFDTGGILPVVRCKAQECNKTTGRGGAVCLLFIRAAVVTAHLHTRRAF